jgi:signal transduction histidine kinase
VGAETLLNLRAKLLFVFIALAFVPLVALSAINYWSGMRSVEEIVRAAADERATIIARRVENLLDEQEKRHSLLAKVSLLRDYVRASQQNAPDGPQRPGAPDVPREPFEFFYRANETYFESLTVLDASGGALFRLSRDEGGEPVFQTRNIADSSIRYDRSVWSLRSPKLLRSSLAHEGTHGSILITTAPIFSGAEGSPPSGAFVAESRMKEILEEAAQANTQPASDGASGGGGTPFSRHVILALDNDNGRIVYHTNGSLRHRTAADSMPYFDSMTSRMRAGGDGSGFYDMPDGNRWLASFRQVRNLNLSLAVTQDYTAASAGVRRAGAVGITLATVTGLAAVLLLLLIVRRATSRIERVAKAAAGIAGGDLDQRIEITGHDETSRLAESFNLMSDRLREQIRRESESKQFESFMRLSAMLTHDLKNAITGLSMLVSNMEKRFDRQEFRADAITSLRDATEKLRRIVSRLSEPLRSLSGEYRRDSRPTDLVPIIRRVLAAQAEPSVPLYEIESHLPDKLVATVEAERIENVIENLVINGMEAMGAAGGRLTVEAGEEDERHVFISVSDTGVGMSEEFIQMRLFRPFSTTKTRGVGLGLFTCREIVETHGGRFEVESKPGAGTRFRIVLPSSLFTSGERHRQAAKGASAANRSG